MKRLGFVLAVLFFASSLATTSSAGAMNIKLFGAAGNQAACTADGSRNLFGGGSFGVGASFLAIDLGGYVSNCVPYRLFLDMESFPIHFGRFRVGFGAAVDYDPNSCEDTDPYMASLGSCSGKYTFRPYGGIRYTLVEEGVISRRVNGQRHEYPEQIITAGILVGQRTLSGDLKDNYLMLEFSFTFQSIR